MKDKKPKIGKIYHFYNVQTKLVGMLYLCKGTNLTDICQDWTHYMVWYKNYNWINLPQ